MFLGGAKTAPQLKWCARARFPDGVPCCSCAVCLAASVSCPQDVADELGIEGSDLEDPLHGHHSMQQELLQDRYIV